MPLDLVPSSFATGFITVAIGVTDRIIVATDSLQGPAEFPPDLQRAIELRPGFVVGFAGLWATIDHRIQALQNATAAFRSEDNATTFLHRYDALYRRSIEDFLTTRFRQTPEIVLKECFCPVNPPHSLVVCEVVGGRCHATIFEYVPMLRDTNSVAVTPVLQVPRSLDSAAFAAVGAAAPLIDVLDPRYVEYAKHGPQGPEYAARVLVEQAIARLSDAAPPPQVWSFPMETGGRVISVRATRTWSRPSLATTIGPPVDTKDLSAVRASVLERFASMYPNAKLTWLPQLFDDVATLFAGAHPDYAAVDLRYHDLEHTLQATLCAALIMEGRHAAGVSPRIDAHYFELAMTAALLHDSGYLKLRSDTSGTGAKYTFCHVLRGCAFASSYLPTLGANGADVESVMAAINCTGPMNEISRRRFIAPADEIIGCIVATADYLGQMAAIDYPDELTILFEEFRESDEYLHVSLDQRAFKTAYELVARTPQFWHRFVLPKLEADFQGVYRFLATPYPDGANAYLRAIEANIAVIERRAQAMAAEQNFGEVLKPTKMIVEAPRLSGTMVVEPKKNPDPGNAS